MTQLWIKQAAATTSTWVGKGKMVLHHQEF
jgi:hypothetical protein